jgi:heat shock protein HslJ
MYLKEKKMKSSQKQIVAFFLAIIASSTWGICACNSTPKFSDVSGKEWLLVEVRTKPENIIFDRKKLVSEGFKGIFSLKFDAERVSGVGAPNRYTAPFSLGENHAIEVKLIAGTMMAPLREPEKLKEHDFFNYVQNASKWDLVNGKLELYTKNESGEEAVMVFAR